MNLTQIADLLAENLSRLQFSDPVSHVYNPLLYARAPAHCYLERFGGGRKEAVFLGMNPGPWGMTQTGVPFGEIDSVRDWLGIWGEVGHPDGEHPKKKVQGFLCKRREVSGYRLWSLFREKYPDPAAFFARFMVLNYCPLLFLDASGRNLTPDKLKPADRRRLTETCDEALRASIACLGPGVVIGVGGFAAARAEEALAGMEVRIGRILHPSPANPEANRGWREVVLKQLQDQCVVL